MIGNLIDANVDVEINKILVKNLYAAPATGIKKDLQVLMIEKADTETLRSLAEYTFSQPHTKEMGDLLKLVIEKADAETLRYLAEYTFSQPHTKEMDDLLKLVIEKADAETLRYLAEYTFSQPHTKEMDDLLKLVIEKADARTLRILARYTFSQPHTKEMGDLLKLVIEKADAETLRYLARYTFSQPHTKEMGDLLKLVIEKADAETLRYLAEYTFSQPHTKEMDDLLKLVIEKADARTLRILAMYTFSQPHTKEMGDLLKLVIEKADAETLQRLAMYTFSQPHTKEMGDLLKLVIEKPDARTLYVLAEHTFSQPHTKDAKFDVLRKAIAIQDPVARKKYLEKNHVNQDVHKEVRPVKTKSSALKFGTQGIKPISSQMKEGDVVTIQNRQFKVVKEVASGRRGIVYQIQGENGAFYALKVAKDSSSDTLDSLAQESAKAKEWQSLGLAHSKVLVQADTYILKTWIPGVSGEEVIKRYKAGDLQSKQALEQLTQLVSLIQAKGAYIGDFRPPNVIWTGKAWVIIDSGSIHKNLNESQVLSKWNAVDEKGPKFERRWQMPAPQNPGTCHAVFQ